MLIYEIMKLFDTHAHLNFPDFEKDREEVIERALREDISLINVGTDIEESKKVIRIAESREKGLYAAAGLHPLYVGKKDFKTKEYATLVKNKKVVAIGETGLDNKGEEKEKQVKIFREHIKLAQSFNLPLIIHCRMAHREVIKILKEEKAGKGVVHCFTGSLDEAEEYLKLGFYLGLNGIIFKMDFKKIINALSLENIVIETDCPFLTPPPKKGRNEPLFLRYIAEKIASTKGVFLQEVEEKTTKNAIDLFLSER